MSTVEVKTTVSKATVYLDRAMVTRTAKVQLKPEIGRIQILHLPLQSASDRVLRRMRRGAHQSEVPRGSAATPPPFPVPVTS